MWGDEIACRRGWVGVGGWRLVAGGAECALVAPSVRWWRRVCAGGVDCAVRVADRAPFPPYMHSQSRHCALDTAASKPIR
ncbi:hypothetical protein PJI17_25760 [Mycobacterium kansasii]